MQRIIIVYILLLAFFSCKKSGRYVDGHVYIAGTNIPIQNAKVMLVITHDANQGEPFSEVRTDENGYFKIKYSKTILPGYAYYVTARADYFSSSPSKYIINKRVNLEFYLDSVH